MDRDGVAFSAQLIQEASRGASVLIAAGEFSRQRDHEATPQTIGECHARIVPPLTVASDAQADSGEAAGFIWTTGARTADAGFQQGNNVRLKSWASIMSAC